MLSAAPAELGSYFYAVFYKHLAPTEPIKTNSIEFLDTIEHSSKFTFQASSPFVANAMVDASIW